MEYHWEVRDWLQDIVKAAREVGQGDSWEAAICEFRDLLMDGVFASELDMKGALIHADIVLVSTGLLSPQEIPADRMPRLRELAEQACALWDEGMG
eukprot:8789970-Alexandrium_andersonii.AAC.1